MKTHKMIFSSCAKCGVDLGPHNCEKISMTDMGLFFTHIDCHGTGFLKLKEVKARAAASAKGDAFKALEIDYYKQRLTEYEAEFQEIEIFCLIENSNDTISAETFKTQIALDEYKAARLEELKDFHKIKNSDNLEQTLADEFETYFHENKSTLKG